MEKLPLSKRIWVIIVANIICFPVGILLAWRARKDHPKTFYAVGIYYTLLSIGIIFGPKKEPPKEVPVQQTAIVEEKKDDVQLQEQIAKENELKANQEAETKLKAEQETKVSQEDKAIASVEQKAQQESEQARSLFTYVGNANTGKFHLARCKEVNKIHEGNKVQLSSRDEAIENGYVPCKKCRP